MMSSKSVDCKELWDNCLKIIKANVEPEAYKTWFEPIVPITLKDNTLIIRLPSHLYYEWLEQNYVSLLKFVIRKELGTSGKLQYRVVMEKNAEEDKTINLPSRDGYAVNNIVSKNSFNMASMSEKSLPDPFVLPGIKKHKIPSNLLPSLNFDNYVEGDCNRLARAAGWAIANEPGKTAFNPFFIYSDVGLGKTHLVHAIGLQTKVNHPDKTVLYVRSDLFYQQFMEAVKNGNINDFIYFYQSVDVLIIDDIQLLSGNKVKTQDAFFNIFSDLHLKSKQIILTSDKSPVEISGFEARLLSRFKWGLTADLTVPDYETRIAIINKKLENNGIVFPLDVVEYLALRITSNTRELEGAIITILAQASLNKKEITVELAKEMVDKFVKNTSKDISIEFIQKVICDHYCVPVSSIRENTRKREVAQARQLCMYFAKQFTKLPLAVIGDLCGHKHHATVLHACRTIHNLYETDKKMRKDMDEIEKKLKM